MDRQCFTLHGIPIIVDPMCPDRPGLIAYMINGPEVWKLESKDSGSGGTKNDSGKPDLSLLPRCFLNEVARCMQFGAIKYDRWNYTKGFEVSRLYAAAVRHLAAFNDGEDIDPESGLSHLGHAAANVLMMLHCKQLGTLRDDRLTGGADASGT